MSTATQATTKHVPGPWTLEGGDTSKSFRLYARRWHFADFIDDSDSCGFDGGGTYNAQLIAAAPELLEALQTLEARITACARAFYVNGKARDLRAAFDGWKDEIEPVRELIHRATQG